MGCWFTIDENAYSRSGLFSEAFSLLQTSIQTIFILNAWWRRTKGNHQNRTKPGREIITFLLVANMAIWFINTLIKNRASFRQSHLEFFGIWAWTIITHTSMPLAIFYRKVLPIPFTFTISWNLILFSGSTRQFVFLKFGKLHTRWSKTAENIDNEHETWVLYFKITSEHSFNFNVCRNNIISVEYLLW